MKTLRFALLVAMLSGIFSSAQPGTASAAMYRDPLALVQGYFFALKTGNTLALSSMIKGKLKESRHQVLHDRPGYARFLRDYYKAAELQDVDIEYMSPNEAKCTLHVRQGMDTVRFQLLLEYSEQDGWKIVDELLE
ncbi:MAG: hypothetical protein WHS86_06490 [Desulfosoma sp.]